MSDESNGSAPEGREGAAKGNTSGGETGIGRTLREARTAANIDVNKICTDLRISPQTLEALEQGNYHLLPGDPYIRALLGSLGRYLGLDPAALVQKYNHEVGAVPAAPVIAPYKDKTQTHTAAHKQIFIGIFAALFIILFLLFRKLGTDGSSEAAKTAPAAPAPTTDTLDTAQDTSLESKSLAPDSSQAKASPDSGETHGGNAVKGLKPAAPPAVKPATPGSLSTPVAPGASVAPAAPAAPAPGAAVPAPAPAAAPAAAAPAAVDSSHLNMAVVKPLIDSVGVKVVRSGKEDFATVLRLGKQMQVSHTDTIIVMTSKRRSVEVTVGGKSVVPDRKRFKIYGSTVKPF
jgi:cytoskeletal protein RodZ